MDNISRLSVITSENLLIQVQLHCTPCCVWHNGPVYPSVVRNTVFHIKACTQMYTLHS